jgi:hypothetical protein
MRERTSGFRDLWQERLAEDVSLENQAMALRGI